MLRKYVPQRYWPVAAAATYAVLAALWIVLSDRVVGALFSDPNLIIVAQIGKGLVFVLGTSFCLYALLRSELRQINEAADALHRSERKVRHLIDSNLIGIVFHDDAGHIRDVNDAFAHIVGRDRTELLASSITFDFLRAAPASQSMSPDEVSVRRPDGTVASVVVGSTPSVDGTARITFVLDVSARREAIDALSASEERLRHAQRLEAVGRLAGGVAHDFNNVLTVILGYANLLISGSGSGDAMREDLEAIRDAGDRAATLTRQLLAFSRRQVLQPKVVDLNATIVDLGRLLKRLIGEDVILKTRLDPELDRVLVDPGQIEQVIVNLVVNARDAMPEGGEIAIETSNAMMGDAMATELEISGGAYVRLVIRDSGVGIDSEAMPHIFEPFFTTKPQGQGSGLGLATVYGIVAQSGGAVLVSSDVGLGTAFSIYLPRVDPES